MTPRQKACKKYRENNKEKVRESSKKYREKNKELIKLRKSSWSLNKDGHKNTYYKFKYGISLFQYNEFLFKQKNLCAICFQPESTKNSQGTIATLCVDHNHQTGVVRGLLCRTCNSALGKFQDKIEVLQSAIKYLNRGILNV